jgi:hypothetical protein
MDLVALPAKVRVLWYRLTFLTEQQRTRVMSSRAVEGLLADF